MSRLITRLSLLLVGLFVAAGLTFGGTQALGSAMNDLCGDEPDGSELDTCPPYDEISCQQDCFQMFGGPGECAPTVEDGDCCICAV